MATLTFTSRWGLLRAISKQKRASGPTRPLFHPNFVRQQIHAPSISDADAYGRFRSAGDAVRLLPHPVFQPEFIEAQLGCRGLSVRRLHDAIVENTEPPFLSPHILFEPDIYLAHLDPSERRSALRLGNPVHHFLRNWHLGRPRFSRFFDVAFYERSLDRPLGKTTNPLTHYLRQPLDERKDANPMFHSLFYGARYGVRDEDGLVHFLTHGHITLCLPNPWAKCEIEATERLTSSALLKYISVGLAPENSA